MLFKSRYKGLGIKFDDGYIQFRNGKYRSASKKEAEFLKTHPDVVTVDEQPAAKQEPTKE